MLHILMNKAIDNELRSVEFEKHLLRTVRVSYRHLTFAEDDRGDIKQFHFHRCGGDYFEGGDGEGRKGELN